MNTRDDLLASILANPADDTVRLVFADWLDENGEPERAEFIRTQIRISELRKRHQYEADRELIRLRDVERTLLRNWWDTWIPELKLEPGSVFSQPISYLIEQDRTVEGPRTRISFDRGFARALWLPSSKWLKHGDAILATHSVDQVLLSTRPDFEVEWAKETLRLVAPGRTFRSWSWLGVHGPDSQEYLLGKEWPTVKFELLGMAAEPEETCPVCFGTRINRDADDEPCAFCQATGTVPAGTQSPY